MDIQAQIVASWQAYSKEQICALEPIQGSGSERVYYRLSFANRSTLIACYHTNQVENKTFVYFAKTLRSAGVCVPRIIYQDPKGFILFEEDIGKKSVLESLPQLSLKEIHILYQAIIDKLLDLQYIGASVLDFQKAYPFACWGKEIVLQDLFYWKHYFLDSLCLSYDAQALIEDFIRMGDYFHQEALVSPYYGFVYRDFQARNILLTEQQNFGFIDFQGGLWGPMPYDVLSLVFQAKASIPPKLKMTLLTYYEQQLRQRLKGRFEKASYDRLLSHCLLLRQLQVLGAYGKRGLIEQKKHFRQSIYLALCSLGFAHKKYFSVLYTQYPSVCKVLKKLSTKSFAQQFSTF